jgi:biotin carboxyl carrier protein
MAGTLKLTLDGRHAALEIEPEGTGYRVRLDDHWYQVELEKTNQAGLYSVLIDGRSWEVFARERTGGLDLLIGTRVYNVNLARLRGDDTATAGATGAWSLLSPMAGQVIEVKVQPGDPVEAGQPLVVIESMKMNNELVAARGGTVAETPVRPGERVEKGRLLVRLT